MTIQRILCLDVETTGIEPPPASQVIEVGAILYSVEHATPIASFATLLPAKGNAAEKVNRIPAAALTHVPGADAAWDIVSSYLEMSDAVLAHFGDFDRQFVPPDVRDGKPWIDTGQDLVWPLATKAAGSLVALALDHGVGVSYAHRALTDCDLIARLLMRVAELGVDMQAFLARGLRPKGLFQALVPFDKKDLAKEAGFKWDAATRRWTRTLAIEDAAKLPFRTARIDAPRAQAAS